MEIQTVQEPVLPAAEYKVTLTDGTILWVPLDHANADYVRVQAWIAAGGTVS